MAQHYMNKDERIQLEVMRRNKIPVAEIARQLGFCRQTIYNELKRGSYVHTCDFWDEERYSAYKGQDIFENQQHNKGRTLKIGNDIEYANYIEAKILQEHYSPAAALASAREAGFECNISVNTCYNYISKGIFLCLCDSDLLEKATRTPRKKEEELKVAHENIPNIENRPIHIDWRREYGHWEMDLIVSAANTSQFALLTLTERKTREEIIIRVPDHKAATIRRAIDRLERNTPGFKKKFKTITTDNGPEFMEYELLKRSVKGGDRFEVYYCHSYAAWEKGTVENHNKIIRRFFPKGTDFSKIKLYQIKEVEDWMNNYPRKILGWKSPRGIAA